MRSLPSRLHRTLVDGARSLLPKAVADLEHELDESLAKAPLRLNQYGYDPYGFHPRRARTFMLPAALLYRFYFRVEAHGIENVPPGKVVLIANHSGQVPYDGAMLLIAMLLEADPPRICRGMGEYFLWKVPWMGVTATRTGTVVGTPENCVAMLESGECVIVFPEGARGANKPFRQRYQLQPFGQGFMRLALESDAPIVPVGIVGPEEQQPGLANFRRAGRFVGLPSLPVTVSFPWLGPLGLLLALPVKYRIHFGKPLHFEGGSDEEDEVIQQKVAVVKQALADLLAHGRRERRGIFS